MNLSYYPIHTVVLQVTKEKGGEGGRENMNTMCTGRKGARIGRDVGNKALGMAYVSKVCIERLTRRGGQKGNAVL